MHRGSENLCLFSWLAIVPCNESAVAVPVWQIYVNTFDTFLNAHSVQVNRVYQRLQ